MQRQHGPGTAPNSPWGSQPPDLLQAIVLGEAAGVPVAADGDLHGGCLAQDPVRHPQGLQGHRCGAGARTTPWPGHQPVPEGPRRKRTAGGYSTERGPTSAAAGTEQTLPPAQGLLQPLPSPARPSLGTPLAPRRTRRVAHPRGTDPSLNPDRAVAPTPSRPGLSGSPAPRTALRAPSHKPRRGSPHPADPAPGQRR